MDSLYHSTYVATSLGFWKERGRQKLLNLLAKMGFPQKECLKPFNAMGLYYKDQLSEKLRDHAGRYNMPQLAFPSFTRRCGYKTAISASDVIYSLSSILDCGHQWVRQYVSGELVTGVLFFLANLVFCRMSRASRAVD